MILGKDGEHGGIVLNWWAISALTKKEGGDLKNRNPTESGAFIT